MNGNDPEFYQASKFQPEPYEPPRGRGCFFYGLVFSGVAFLLLIGICGGGLFFGYKAAEGLVTQWTATAPQPLPKVDIPQEKQAALRDRVAAFRKALDTGEETPPLELSGDDINALIEQNPDFKDKIYVTLEGDKIKGKVSLPLDKIGENLPLFGRLVMGRYLNGEAELKASLKEGMPSVFIDSLVVNGQQLPEQFMDGLRRENLAKDASREPKNAEMIRKLESIEIKESKLIIAARTKDKRTQAPDDAAKSKPSPEVKSPASVAPPEHKSAPTAEPAPPTPPAKPASPSPAPAPAPAASPADAAPAKKAG